MLLPIASLLRARLGPHRDLLALLALLAGVATVLVGPALLPGAILAPNDIVTAGLPGYAGPPASVHNPILGDVAYAINPWRLLARTEWAAGRLPLWNDRQLLGTPLLANLQSAVVSPWSGLLALAPPGQGLALLTWLKLLLAGLGMGLFLRRCRLTLPAVALGALSFMLCSHMVTWLQWTIAEVFLLGPWLLWCVRGWLDTDAARWLLGWALVLAIALVGGHAESAWNIGGLAAAYGLYGRGARAWAARRARPWGPLLGDSLRWGGASVLGAGLAAVQLLPFLTQLPISLQASDRAILAAQRVFLPPEAALTWLVPNVVGNPLHGLYWGTINYNETTTYIGLIPLVLAPLAFLRPPRGEAAFWLGAAVVSLSMAWHLPGPGWLADLPGFSSALAYRFAALAQIALIILGARGLTALQQAWPAHRPATALWWGGSAGAVLILGLGLALHLPWYSGPHPTTPDAYRAVWFGWALVLLGALAALLLGAWGGRWPVAVLAGGLLVLAALDGLRFAWGYNYATPAATFYPPTAFTRALDAQPGRGAVLGTEAPADLALAYGWRDYRAYDPMLDNRHKLWVRLMSRGTYHGATAAPYATAMNLLPPRPDMYSILGLAWVAARDPLDPNALPAEPIPVPPPPAGPAFVRTATVAGFGLWRNQYARPFAYFAGQVRLAPDGDAVWQFYRNQPGAGWDLTLVEGGTPDLAALPAAQHAESPPDPGPAALAVGAGTVAVIRQTPGQIELAVRRPAGQAGLLVVNESWAAGWQATLDGAPVVLRRVNYLAQGVLVPGGAHTVRLVYWPAEVAGGLGLSAASGLIWCVWLGLTLWSGLSRAPSNPPSRQ